jgi:hypothetical protein
MDLYQTFASLNFPGDYKSSPEIKSKKFIVYKGDTPLETTWDKWYRGIELAEVGLGQPRRVVVSVPQGEVPGNNYSIIYYPLPEMSSFSGYQKFEVDLSWLAPLEGSVRKNEDEVFGNEWDSRTPKPIPSLLTGLAKEYGNSDIKRISLHLKRKEEVDLSQERKGWYNFYIKSLGFYHKFAYPIKDKKLDEKLREEIRRINLPLVMLNEKLLGTDDFEDWSQFTGFERGGLIQKRIELAKGKHTVKVLENATFKVEYAIFEPVTHQISVGIQEEPEIIFKKINPTKYYVKVEGAEGPFWLVFSESFHQQWRLYRMQDAGCRMQDEIIAEYPNLGVKESRHLQRFTPEDIRYLFRKPLDAEHHLVNGYANGWYIEPEKLGLGENFILVIYFWPQSLFYLGLFISGFTLIGCLSFLGYSSYKNIRKCRG